MAPYVLLIVLGLLAVAPASNVARDLRWHLSADNAPAARPFYIRKEDSIFYPMAIRHDTDKVTLHHYETLYNKYFEAPGSNRRLERLKVLEIGLGCNMRYGPGHSAALWREYFPNAELWFAEYDAVCTENFKDKLHDMQINYVTGDQSNRQDLERWVNTSGGNFDVIIDDGGHTSMQQFMSATVLFEIALKPGGVYFVEDLQIARHVEFIDGDKKHVMIEVIKDWLEGLVMSSSGTGRLGEMRIAPDMREVGLRQYLRGLMVPCWDFVRSCLDTMQPVLSLTSPSPNPGSKSPQRPGAVPYLPRFKLLPHVKTLDCADEMCAMVKCLDDDERCPIGLPESGEAAIDQPTWQQRLAAVLHASTSPIMGRQDSGRRHGQPLHGHEYAGQRWNAVMARPNVETMHNGSQPGLLLDVLDSQTVNPSSSTATEAAEAVSPGVTMAAPSLLGGLKRLLAFGEGTAQAVHVETGSKPANPEAGTTSLPSPASRVIAASVTPKLFNRKQLSHLGSP